MEEWMPQKFFESAKQIEMRKCTRKLKGTGSLESAHYDGHDDVEVVQIEFEEITARDEAISMDRCRR